MTERALFDAPTHAEIPVARKRVVGQSLRAKLLLAGSIPLALPLLWAGVAVAQGCSAG